MSAKIDSKENEVDTRLQCIMCNKVLEIPRLLPCLHSICTKCLKAAIDSNKSQGTISCHKCNESFSIPAEEVQGFPVNVFLQGELGVYSVHDNKEKHCEICSLKKKKTPAKSKCIDCGDLLCEACGGAHSSTRLTIAHRVTPLEEIAKGSHDLAIRKMNRIPCLKHEKELLNSFCEDCDLLICRECRLTSHLNHSCGHVDDVDMNKHADVPLGVRHLEKRMELLVDICKGVDLTLTEIDQQEQNSIEEVEETTKRLASQIEHEKADIIERIRRQMNAQREKCKDHKEVVSSRSDQIKESVDFCKNVTEKGKNEESLYLESCMLNRLQYLDQQPSVKQEVICQFPEVRLKNMFGSVDNIRFFDFLPGPPSSIPLIQEEDPVDPNVPRIAHLHLIKKINTFTADDDTAPKITGLATDRSDRLLVSDGANRKIKRFMATGKYLETVHRCKPLGMAVSDDVVATTDHFGLTLVSPDGILKVRLDNNAASYPISSYEGIHFALANTRSQDISIYDKYGEVLKTIAIPRTMRKARSRNIYFLAANSKGEFIAADWGTNSLLLIDLEGNIIQEFRCQGSTPRDWLPGNISIDIHDNIFVADHQRGSIMVLSPNLRVVYKHSTKREYLERPMHACFDSNGNMFVSGKSGIVNVYSCKYV
ncbi:hypothetical protein FSP39_019974 [Pinctada imbricata]|uniref:Uncharacterized protein n=1 Tax=Pinctada imbricata TaxID=66713 RepID=A0AA88Y064_PINIB|nr:hypothetical protein FSP39_019974 [Pinctada imbricata]